MAIGWGTPHNLRESVQGHSMQHSAITISCPDIN